MKERGQSKRNPRFSLPPSQSISQLCTSRCSLLTPTTALPYRDSQFRYRLELADDKQSSIDTPNLLPPFRTHYSSRSSCEVDSLVFLREFKERFTDKQLGLRRSSSSFLWPSALDVCSLLTTWFLRISWTPREQLEEVPLAKRHSIPFPPIISRERGTRACARPFTSTYPVFR